MKRMFWVFIAIMLACVEAVEANNGVYFTSGSFLVPTVETDISAVKAILTITIGKDSYARADVYYEFANGGSPKTITMAFETSSQCGDTKSLNHRDILPNIKDFAVSMNGERMKCTNSEVGYSFDAPFKHGLNVVHHTYKYRMGYNNREKFVIPYRLTPATRWANGKVDDFTLRITADDSMVGFCLVDTLFASAPFFSVKGRPVYHMKSATCNSFLYTYIIEGDTIVWHSRDFRPTGSMSINSPWWETQQQSVTSAEVVIDSCGEEARYIADCGDSYFVSVQDFVFVKKAGSRKVLYDAHNGQGCIYIAGNGTRRIRVRRAPSTKSLVVCTISDSGEGIPEVYPCLGLVSGDDNHNWYKTKVNGKTGYIRQDLMQWDAINTF